MSQRMKTLGRRFSWAGSSRDLASTRLVALWFLAALGINCASEGLHGAPPSSRPATAGQLGDGKLAEQLDAIRGKYRLPALAAVTFGPDGVIEAGFSGVRALGHPELVTENDDWHIGSLTKSMTATVAAILIEQGRIGWDTTIAEVFPDIPRRAEFDPVTLNDLLTNSGGIAQDATQAPSWASLANSQMPIRDQRRTLVKEFLVMTPSAPRGTFNYSNAGYIVAGAMLEQVMDESWEDLMRRLLFLPLGMVGSGFGPPAGPGPVDEPWGHSIVDDGFGPTPPGPNADNPPAIGPAGTVHANLADLAHYYEMHLGGARGEDRLVSAATFGILHQPAPGTSYACGWGMADRPWGGGGVLQHAGSNNFWYADVWLAPVRGFGVLILTNAAGPSASAATNDGATMLITRFNGEAP